MLGQALHARILIKVIKKIVKITNIEIPYNPSLMSSNLVKSPNV